MTTSTKLATAPAAKKRAAIYTRISKDLDLEGLGVARQLEDCRKYAAANDLEIVAELEDNNITGSGLKTRPSYLELRELMEGRLVDQVLVYSTSRLHRSMKELVEFIELSQSSSVGIVSITGGAVNLETADGRALAHILGAVDSQERERAAERIKRKHLELAESGAWPGRRVYGYEADATVIPAEAAIIRELAERVLAGGEGFNEIAKDLNNRGIGTVTNATWRASTITTILRSARIAGSREHHGVITAKNAWAAIVDNETSMMLRARLAPGQSGLKRGGPRLKLLTGLLRCGKCGFGLVGGFAGKARTPNYRCARNQGAPNCGSISINAGSTEEFLTEVLFQIRDRSTEPVATDEKTVAQWAAAREKLEQRRADLAEMVGSGEMEMADWAIASKALKKKLAELPVPDVRPRKARQTSAELQTVWPAMPVAERRTLLEEVFVEVKVLPRIIVTGAKTFDPRRLVPVFRE